MKIGFYFLAQVEETDVANHFKLLDGDSEFLW